MEELLPTPGLLLSDVDTPALLVDLPLFEANLHKVADFYQNRPAKIRPHVKGHKSPDIARLQLAAGSTVGGLATAKLGEAEVMVDGGFKDVLIFNQITSVPKMRRLSVLAKRAKVTVAADDPGNIEELSEAAQASKVNIGVCVEVDIGLGRSGVAPGNPTVAMVQTITKATGLTFEGLLGYEGAQMYTDFEERMLKTRERIQRLLDAREMVENFGYRCNIVGAGGTSTWNIAGTFDGITEVQPGRYVIADLFYKHLGDFDVSLKVLSTVTSKPRKGLAIIDCGHKAIHLNYSGHVDNEKRQYLIPEFTGLPLVEYPAGARLTSLDAEHGRLELTGDADQLRRGDKVILLPAYEATPVNQHDYFLGIRNGLVETVWPITAARKFR